MAARSFASVTISFGLVSIPVDIYSTEVASTRLSFNLLHARDGARVDAAIRNKIRSGKEISHFEAPDTHDTVGAGNVVDLMEVLQRSLSGKGAAASAGTRKPPRRVTRPAGKSRPAARG